MEKELNIAAILKDKPKGTKLWSPIFGECKLSGITVYNDSIQVATKSSYFYFREDGRYIEEGEVCLFPSKQMQDWSKFTWKKGDVLISDNGEHCIFNGWTQDAYNKFDGRYSSDDSSTKKFTYQWNKETKGIVITEFIKKVEEHYGGKLNLETLEIEKQPEFKDGDILVFDEDPKRNFSKIILIYRCRNGEYIKHYARFNVAHQQIASSYTTKFFDRTLRPATDSEKQQLFDALAKEDKRWNPDTKTIEDLPKKCELKPFDKVLVRNTKDEVWLPNLFGFYDKEFDNYVCLNEAYQKCIPYNDQTAHLLGTTDEWKGGNNG